MIMVFSPSLSVYPTQPSLGFFDLVLLIIRFPFEFILDTLRTLPLPTMMSILLPAVLFFVKYAGISPMPSSTNRIKLGIIMLMVLLIAYILIAASFAPSAYGGSYPAGRARFAGRWVMTIALMVEGSLLGIWITGLRTKFFEPVRLRFFASLVFLLLALYPLRIAWRVSADIPAYQQRAAAWDLRDSEIRALKAQGAQDLFVRSLPEEQVQDLGDHEDFRLNRCASIIYGVDSIVTVRMGEE